MASKVEDVFTTKRTVEDVSTSKLHSDTMIQIFLKLPIKSIIRFKSVGRAWNDLFSSQSFIGQHCGIVKSSAEKTHMLSLLVELSKCDINKEKDTKEEIFSLLVDGNSVIERRLDIPIERQNHQVCRLTVIGCINGLVCLEILEEEEDGFLFSSFMLWNPVIRKQSCTPKPPQSETHHCVAAGFAYDQITNSYMIIRILLDEESEPSESIVEIYSTRTNSWTGKEIEGITFDFVLRFHGIVISGVAYWVVSSMDESSHDNLIWFDPLTECIRFFSVEKDEEKFSFFASVGEDLALIAYQGSWASITKLIKDGNGGYHIEKSRLELEDVAGFGSNGEVIVTDNYDKLVLYDPKESKNRLLTRHAKGYTWIHHYTHSLVWPSTLLT